MARVFLGWQDKPLGILLSQLALECFLVKRIALFFDSKFLQFSQTVTGILQFRFGLPCSGRTAVSIKGCYLVEPASSHMLVSKIKPCMSKYKQFIH